MSGPEPMTRPSRILMSIDAVGGVWRYAMDLGKSLADTGIEVVFANFGPAATAGQIEEAEAIGRYIPVAAPLDWTAGEESELAGIAGELAALVGEYDVDLLHLNLPSQAAGLSVPVPVVVVSHSCVVTWFQAVRGTATPPDWQWQVRLNRAGFAASDAIIAPSRSHADLLTTCYGALPGLHVVHNASRPMSGAAEKDPFVIAAGRWWDDGKNGRVLDEAAQGADLPVIMAGSTRGPNGQYLAIEHARYLGEVPHTELRDLMRRSAVFASPSLYEPFGLAALEAALSGAALVLADIPTYRELWDGAALFAAPEDPAAFRSAIDRLSADDVMRKELAKAAEERASRYSLAAQRDAMLALYARVLTPAEELRRAG